MAEHDLLPKLVPHLDRHLVFPLLQFADDDEDEPSEELLRAKFTLLKETNMTDFVGELDAKLHAQADRRADYGRKREEVLQQLDEHRKHSSAITGLLDDSDVVSNLRSDKVANLNYLKEHHGVTVEMVDQLYDFGQFQYSCGSYASAAELLYQFRILSTDNDKVAQATWGKLASEILTLNWESAMEEIQKLKDNIESRLFSNALGQLQNRVWLMHWSLFPFFNYEPAREQLTELFFSPPFINTIQTACPWMLRYLTAAVVTARSALSRASGAGATKGATAAAASGALTTAAATTTTAQQQKQLKELVRIVRQEAYEYQDPLTDFVKALYVDFDFEEAQRALLQAEDVLRTDFFLAAAADAFVDAARHLISESYCKIHQRIDTRDLSARLGLSQDEGEKWIVNLIRDTRVDAKIDYKDGTVLMNHPPQSVYQQVIERTKGAFFRTQVLSAAVAK